MSEANQVNGLAIITGATGGMGAATAREMASRGWPLLVCDLDAARLEALAQSIGTSGGAVEILAGDVSDPGFPDTLAKVLGDRPIGAVVHAAGLSPTMADAARILAVNYEASARLVALIRPRMAAGACAVLISSSSAYECNSPEFEAAVKAIVPGDDASSLLGLSDHPGLAYMLSKRGVQLLVQQQAAAFGARGARIMSISPGLIDTSMGRLEQQAHPQMDVMLSKTPLARYGTPEEIATVAAFLCSPEAAFVSGSDIKVDGGVLAEMLW